jgi:hypothetical protein
MTVVWPRFVSVLALGTAAWGCAPTTHLTAVWSAPQIAPIKFKKVLVAAQSKEQVRRRAIEDYLVRRIENATASHQFLSEDEVRDAKAAKAKVVAGGFDGAVVVRFVGTTQTTTHVPGVQYWGSAPYGSIWGYWGYGWGAVYEPGYLETDTVVTLESNIYSVLREELLWSSRSDTISPDSIESLMQSVIEQTVKEMKKRHAL